MIILELPRLAGPRLYRMFDHKGKEPLIGFCNHTIALHICSKCTSNHYLVCKIQGQTFDCTVSAMAGQPGAAQRVGGSIPEFAYHMYPSLGQRFL